MKLYKRNGSKRWHITFYADGIRRRMAISTNKKATEKIASAIDGILACHGSLTPELQMFVNGMNPQLRDKLLSFGVLSKKHIPQADKHAGKPLIDHIRDFGDSLKARTCPKYARHTELALVRILDRFDTIDDIDAHAIYKHLADMKGPGGIGQRTFNGYVKLVKQFYQWLIEENRAKTSPLEHLKTVTQTEFRCKRRALSLDDQQLLVEAAAAGKYHSKMTGHERALLYRTALLTGLRADELRSLTVSCFDFTARTVTLTKAQTKNKKFAVLTLPQTLNNELKIYTVSKAPMAQVFKIRSVASLMIKQDLIVAGIEYKTEDGTADFHALRHSFITNLARAGVHPSDAMALARHSTITLTMNYYTHTTRESLQGIIDSQPDLAPTKAKAIS